MRLIPHTGQRHCHAQPSTLRLDRALHEVVDGELLSNLRGGLRRAFVTQGASLDPEVVGIDLRQRRARLVGQTAGQVLTIRIATEVHEWQDGDGDAGHRHAAAHPGQKPDRHCHSRQAHRQPDASRRPTRCGFAGHVRHTDRGREWSRLDFGNEPIPLAGYGFDKPWGIRRIPQGLPHLADGRVDTGLDVDEHLRAPESFDRRCRA